jgi:hypothetical protein
MAVVNHQLFVYDNGRKIKDSNDLEVIVKALAVSADGNDNGLTISESSGKFNFNSKVLGGVASPSANGEVLIYDMLGANSGIATLDSGGKVPVTQLPNSVMEYKGTYDPTGGSGAGVPALANGTGNAGDLYKVTVAGSHDFGAGALTMVVGDYVIYSGSIWEVVHSGADSVISVNGQSGVVSLDTDDVSEGTTNLYFTDARAKAAAVADSITDGVTDVAPSQNAVFDALALKADASALGGGQYASFTNKETAAITARQFVKMTTAGEVTLLAAADSVNDESFFGCVKDASIAADASGAIYLPEVGARVTGFTGLDVTKFLYASSAGGYTQTRPTTGKVIILGRAMSASEIIFIGRFEAEYV